MLAPNMLFLNLSYSQLITLFLPYLLAKTVHILQRSKVVSHKYFAVDDLSESACS